jgi:hypothetical protein
MHATVDIPMPGGNAPSARGPFADPDAFGLRARTTLPQGPRRGVSRQHAFVTIVFLIVCALDCLAAKTLPTALMNHVVGPALVSAWLGILVVSGLWRGSVGPR